MPQTNAGESLRDQRLRRGLTLVELAQHCTDKGTPVSDAQLSRIERGIHQPRPRLRLALADILGVDPVSLETVKVAS